MELHVSMREMALYFSQASNNRRHQREARKWEITAEIENFLSNLMLFRDPV
jgi:hypothetical protein